MSGECCNCRCHCDTGRLPYTLTVSASGFEKHSYVAVDMSILGVSSCFGSGGIVRVVSNGATISSAELLDPGSGYAIKGRVQPTIELTAPTLRGADCTFTPTFTQHSLECSECYQWWTLTGGTVDCDAVAEIPDGNPSPGETPLTIRISDGHASTEFDPQAVFQRLANRLAVRYHRAEPTLTASLSGGSGAELTPVLEAKAPGWAVASVTVNAGGSGYTEGQAVQFSTLHMEESPAAARAFTAITEPQMSASVFSFAGGSGAELSVGLSETTAIVFSYNLNGEGNAIDVSRPRFVVSGVTIQSGGSGYAVGDEVRVATTNGQSSGTTSGHFVPPPRVSSVSGGGAITGISFTPNSDCKFWRDTGVVEFVEVTSWGAYCLPVPFEVFQQEFWQLLPPLGDDRHLVTADTRLWAEDDEAEPCVANPFASYGGLDESNVPCTVSTENDDTFGTLVAATVQNGSAPDMARSSAPRYLGCIDGQYVLVAEQTSPTLTFSVNADYGDGAVVLYGYGGTECSSANHLYQRRVPPLVVTGSPFFQGPQIVSATLAEVIDEDGLPAWTIDSLSVEAGCAEDGLSVYFQYAGDFSVSTPDLVVITPPAATIQADENNTITGVTIDEPGLFYRKFPWDGQPGEIQRVTVVNGGSGYAVIGREQPQSFSFSPSGAWTPTLEEHDDAGRPYWTITDLAIPTSGGYADGQSLQLQQSPPEFSTGFQCIIRTKRQQPSVSLTASGPSGSGATFAVTLESTGASPPNETWRVAAVTVTNGGSAYFTLGTTLSFGGGVALSQASATPVIGSNGAITAVTLTNAGEYYGDSGIPDRVEITNGGKLWRNNSSLPSHVANVTVAVEQVPPSEGSGAELQAVIDDDPSSETFGQITAVTVVNGGSNYTPFIRRPGACTWTGQCRTEAIYVGVFGIVADPVALLPADQLGYLLWARTSTDGRLFVGHLGKIFTGPDDSPPLQGDAYSVSLHYTESPIADCSSFTNLSTQDPNTDGTFTISSGGVLDPEECPSCTENCPSRPVTLAATASVSITIPNYPNAMGGNVDLPVCCQGEHTAEDIPLGFSCNDPDSWLSGTATLDRPGGCVIDTSITCEIKLVQDEACALFLEVTFTGNCKERYEDGGDVFERPVTLTKVAGPLGATENEDGLLVPDDITDLDISFDSENDYAATISVTFET